MRREPPSPKQRVTAVISLPSGGTVEGWVAHIDDFSISIVTSEGEYRTFARNGDDPKVVLHDPLQFHTDMLTKYTDSEIHNLTAYLVTLK
jgi:cytochrome c oxidase cbb3-type subunit 3